MDHFRGSALFRNRKYRERKNEIPENFENFENFGSRKCSKLWTSYAMKSVRSPIKNTAEERAAVL